MRRTRVGLVVLSCLAGALLIAPAASAQPKGAPPPSAAGGAGADRSNSQFNLKHDGQGAAEGQAARGQARGGDCKGALTIFDAALRSSIDPALRRDRGLCHESLGNVFPAIDDYRAYLHARPDAPDADQIRQRLDALEDQTGTNKSSSANPSKERERDRETGGAGRASASASFSVGSEGASGKASAGGSASTSTDGKRDGNVDKIVEKERLVDSAESSPLRYGTGVVLGPFVHIPRFWVGDRASSKLGYGVGLAFRYSTGSTLSLISELGYAGIGTSGEASSMSGPLLMGGVEARLPISRYAGDHILLRGGLGYERQVVSGTRFITDNVLGRFGLGYRHVFGSSLALELLADGGPAFVMPESGSSRVNFVIGGSLAFVVGF